MIPCMIWLYLSSPNSEEWVVNIYIINRSPSFGPKSLGFESQLSYLPNFEPYSILNIWAFNSLELSTFSPGENKFQININKYFLEISL